MVEAERESQLRGYLGDFMDHPSYRRVVRMVMDKRRYRQGIEDSPHGQAVADGYRQGFDHVFEIMEQFASEAPSEEKLGTVAAVPGGGLVEVMHPDLDNS